MAISYATQQPRENYLKKITLLAAIALAMAFGSTVFAQANNPKDAIQFAGHANANGMATIDVTGNLTGYSANNPLKVHVTDGTHDVTCLFTVYNGNAITYDAYPGNQAGKFTLDIAYAQCVNNHNGGEIGAQGKLVFDRWMSTQLSSVQWNIQADSTYLEFNCPPLWIVSPFSGVGTVYNP